MKKRVLFRIAMGLLCLALLGVLAVAGVNVWVWGTTASRLLTEQQAAALQDMDCILVLGCGVREDGTPSPMLADRLKRGIALYDSGAAPKLLMSGDHGRKEYDEVNTMKRVAMEAGVPSEDVFMDHAGFSTYESLYRARDVFAAKKVIIVSQGYHLYRALYIARQLGVEAYGVAADYRAYAGQTVREVREVLARCKDFAVCIFQPAPTFLGEVLPVSGNGDVTNDEKAADLPQLFYAFLGIYNINKENPLQCPINLL